MKVFILKGFGKNGQDTLGVYSTKGKAEAARDRAEVYDYAYMVIQEHEVK